MTTKDLKAHILQFLKSYQTDDKQQKGSVVGRYLAISKYFIFSLYREFKTSHEYEQENCTFLYFNDVVQEFVGSLQDPIGANTSINRPSSSKAKQDDESARKSKGKAPEAEEPRATKIESLEEEVPVKDFRQYQTLETQEVKAEMD